mmetsp:Transcript_1215/g.1521  ORF Transcript_1215/g.1521 Transcript_1215/m.1521 type:complete len:314 (-) Transcript_1215:21-962(-)
MSKHELLRLIELLDTEKSKILVDVEEKLTTLQRKEEELQAKEDRLESLFGKLRADAEQDKVKLNVGGTFFTSTKKTLASIPDSYFCALLSSEWQPDEDGAYFIDRDPVYFSRILSGLRNNGKWNVSGLNTEEKKQLQDELDYFCLSNPLIKSCHSSWSATKIGTGLRVSEDGKTLTAVDMQTGYRCGVLDQVFHSVKELPSSMTMRINHVGGSNGYMEFGLRSVNNEMNQGFMTSVGAPGISGQGFYSHRGTRMLASGQLLHLRVNKSEKVFSFWCDTEQIGSPQPLPSGSSLEFAVMLYLVDQSIELVSCEM